MVGKGMMGWGVCNDGGKKISILDVGITTIVFNNLV